MYLAILKKYYHFVTVPFIFFTAWLWSFPMYGPLMTITGSVIGKMFVSFLISHALGLLLSGFMMDYLNDNKEQSESLELNLHLFFSLAVGILTALFPFIKPFLFLPALILIGLLSGPLVVFYLSNLARGGAYYRGRKLALIFFLAGIISIIFLFYPVANWMFVVNGLFLFVPLIFLFIPVSIDGPSVNKDAHEKEMELSKTRKEYWIGLVLLVVMFYIGGGLMYNLSYGSIYSSGGGNFDMGFLLYTAAVIPVGILADKKGRKFIIGIGLSLLGMGFLLMLIYRGSISNSFALGLLQSGFAAMDIFVLLTLMDWMAVFTSKKFMGAGLSLNVTVVLLSSWSLLTKVVRDLIPEEYIPAVGLVAILLTIPLLNLINETSSRKERLGILQERYFDLEGFYDKYSLTSREREVADMLLDGHDTSTIADKLSISYNTLKTHLRNIYKKTEAEGQTGFILMVWKETEG